MAFHCRTEAAKFLGVGIGIFCTLLAFSFAELERVKHPIKKDGSLSFLVIGDWGRSGSYNQSEVAFQMGRIGEQLDIDFVISTGDNFYEDGLKSVSDPLFKDSFSKVYTAQSLQKPWYSILGNHDYRGNVGAQLSPELRKIDSRWFCRRSFILKSDIAEFFFVDTTPFVDDYFYDPEHIYHWKGVMPRTSYLTSLLRDLEKALRESNAKWKIVVGHHAIRSAGHHGDTRELIQLLLPMMKANNVDMYMNGHDHCLEHITSHDSSIQYLTSGGGSKAWRGDVKHYNRLTTKFFYDGQGFMSVKLSEENAHILFYDVFGNTLHEWRLTNELLSDM
ncbi:purple acid phosphatase 3-like [Carica papaya]|uniref:purple acid phosphatase 3-like n=1 Tax=Carica papaya TaxID=3649 RepID=UPI000B8CDCCC|nr:purple acid phosphatase 3-like [Carica papaya]